MPNEPKKYYRKYQSSERYFQTSNSQADQSYRRNRMSTGSQTFQNQTQGYGYYQRRQVYAYGSVNPLMQEYEADPIKIKNSVTA